MPATAATPVQILFVPQLSFGSIGQNGQDEGDIKLKLLDQTQWLLNKNGAWEEKLSGIG